MKISQIIKNYWNNQYKARKGNDFPSQFSSFVLNEIDNPYPIIDCGCGNGRDSVFFLKYNKVVYGLDSSLFAINLCKRKQSIFKKNSKFLLTNFDSKNEVYSLIKKFKKINNNFNIYARFFIHAISKNTENNFLEFASTLCGLEGKIFLEFRTKNDSIGKKTFPRHFRRFIDIKSFKEIVKTKDLKIEYITQGKGFAKYFFEDPYVARVILKNKKKVFKKVFI